jgi:hypothetical protein
MLTLQKKTNDFLALRPALMDAGLLWVLFHPANLYNIFW